MRNLFYMVVVFGFLSVGCNSNCEELKLELETMEQEYQELLTEKVNLEAQLKAQKAVANSLLNQSRKKAGSNASPEEDNKN